MNVRWTHLLAVLMLVALLPVAPAKSAVIRAPYEGPAVLAYGGLGDCSDAVRKTGTVCLDLPQGTKAIDLRVTDLSDLAVGGSYYLHAADGTVVDANTYCRSAAFSLPAGATLIVVRVEGVAGPLNCVDQDKEASGPVTKGIVAVRLR